MRSKKTSPTTQNQTFVARSQQALDDNIHDIDGDTRRELRSIREQALANPARKSLFSGSRAAVAAKSCTAGSPSAMGRLCSRWAKTPKR
jgi:hypothetical protein